MAQTITKGDLKAAVRESVREAFKAELMKLRSSTFPFVTSREQRALEKLQKRPTRKVARTISLAS